MKKSNIVIISIIIGAFGLVLSYQMFQSNEVKNGFNRKIVTQNYSLDKVIKLPSSFFYFAGDPKDKLHFKDLKNSTTLYSVDLKLNKIKARSLNVPDEISTRKNKVNIGIVDTAIYISGNLGGKLTIIPFSVNKRYIYDNPKIWFDQTFLFSKSTVFGRSATTNNGNLALKLIKFNYLKDTVRKTFNLKSEPANSFSIDGQLQLDNKSKKLFYMFFYKGSFLSLDTNLNLIYEAKTIDTIRSVSSKTVSLATKIKSKTETKITQAEPRNVINRSYTLYNGILYLVSSLKADNENFKNYRESQIVDAYLCTNGKYLYSFYIPKYKRNRLREFRIKDNMLFAIFDDFLVSYKKH